MLRRFFLTFLLLEDLIGCGGRASSSAGIEGYYPIERVCITTEPVARTATSPGALQESGRWYSAGLTHSVVSQSGKIRVATDADCSFIANVSESGVVTAINTECDPLTQDSALWGNGIEARTNLCFSFDPKEGISREHAMAYLRWPSMFHPEVPLMGYNVCEGHISTKPSPKDVFLVT